MIALIDNYDSFTFNLYHLLCQFSSDIYVFPNDKITPNELSKRGVKALIFSPGPGHPSESGNSKAILDQFYQKIPILGVCLGMQLIASFFGARCSKMQKPSHGIQSKINYTPTNLLKNFQGELLVGRYHSLEVLDSLILRENFNIDAWDNTHTIMSITHKKYPIYGVQYHPESILTPKGAQIISQFFNCI